MNKLEIILL